MGARYGFAATFAAALVANLLPLTAKYLPFSDLSGHMGLAGAMAHAREPEARTAEYFIIRVRLLPSHLYDLFASQLGRLIGVPAATNLFFAIFVVAALPLSLLYTLRVFRRDERLALLVFPLIYHRCVWYGFVNYVAGVPMVIAGVGLLASLLECPRERPRALAWRALALAALGWLVVFTHFFAAAAFFGFAALLLALRPFALHRQPVALLALAPGARFLWAWMHPKLRPPGEPTHPTFVEQLQGAQSFYRSLELFYDWSIDGLASRVDDRVIRVTFWSLVAAWAWALWSPAPSGDRTRWRLRAPLMLAATAVVFLALPLGLDNPPWWAVNVRVVALVWVLAILCVPRASRPTPAWLLAPVAAAGIGYGLHLTQDFHRWYNGVEMAGLDRALDHIPPGRRVQALWPPFDWEWHYSHFPMAHAGAYYTARRGGLAVPMMDAVPDDLWVTPTPRPPQPGWGWRHEFRWREHGVHWDYFLVKDPAPGSPPAAAVFDDAPAGAVRLVTQQGLWRVYQRVQ